MENIIWCDQKGCDTTLGNPVGFKFVPHGIGTQQSFH